ncbi:hypothetical protein R3P38DRAFT_3463788 [Favolaschia claudopus]|uniref:Uncharacterized protein n=1 Tax=Favolaschia claudopus TaxID=2862362 RepID=A0AAV9ZGN9_9AGAR
MPKAGKKKSVKKKAPTLTKAQRSDYRLGKSLIALIEDGRVPQDKLQIIQQWVECRDPEKLDVERLEALLPPDSVSAPGISQMIKEIKHNAGKTGPILAEIRKLATKFGGYVGVCAKPIMFIDEKQKKSPQFTGIPFDPYGTISALTAFKSPPPFVIALVVCPANPVGITVEQWASAPMHCNVLVVVSTPKVPGRRSGGKAVVVCEPNITDVETREDIAKHIIHNRVFDMLRHIKRTGTSSQVWVNNKREVRNNAGICLRLALEWMVELVSGGKNPLSISRNDEGRVVAIEGFRSIHM